jgi:hypothetical protein
MIINHETTQQALTILAQAGVSVGGHGKEA